MVRQALQEKINALAEERLPGWTPEMLVTRGDAEAVLSVSFVPQMPMILAVNPSFTSTSLPTLLYGEFRDDLQGHLAPLVGLPVKWASKHSADLARWTESYINDQMLVRRSNSSAEASFQASQISNMNVRIESRNYTIAAWRRFTPAPPTSPRSWVSTSGARSKSSGIWTWRPTQRGY